MYFFLFEGKVFIHAVIVFLKTTKTFTFLSQININMFVESFYEASQSSKIILEIWVTFFNNIVNLPQSNLVLPLFTILKQNNVRTLHWISKQYLFLSICRIRNHEYFSSILPGLESWIVLIILVLMIAENELYLRLR